MKKLALVFILFSLLLVLGCKINEENEESNVVLTKGEYFGGIQYEDQSWFLHLFFLANNTSETEGFVCNVVFRFLLDDVVIATIDNINQVSLPNSTSNNFYSNTDWHVYPHGSSSIKYYASGNHIFLDGKKPQKVEIIAYIKNINSKENTGYITTITEKFPILYSPIW